MGVSNNGELRARVSANQVSSFSQAGYDHRNYLPSDGDDRWQRVAEFMKRTFLGEMPTWP
jgi:hypothetical protein